MKSEHARGCRSKAPKGRTILAQGVSPGLERPSPRLRCPSPARAGEGKGRGRVPLNPRLTPWAKLYRSFGAILCREFRLQDTSSRLRTPSQLGSHLLGT